MEKIFLFSFVVLFYLSANAQQTDSSGIQKLIPVESLTGKIKPDTSGFTSTDTSKVDTVYIDNPLNITKAGVNIPSAYGFASVAYERVIHYMGSLQIKLEYLGTYNPLGAVSFIQDAYKNTIQIRGLGVTPEIRYYGSEKYAPKGPFVGFYIPLQFAKVKVPQTITANNSVYSVRNSNLNYTLTGIGFNGGYQHIFKSHITLEGLIGLGIARGKFSEEFYTRNYINQFGREAESRVALKDGTIGKAFYPRAEISIGYSF